MPACENKIKNKKVKKGCSPTGPRSGPCAAALARSLPDNPLSGKLDLRRSGREKREPPSDPASLPPDQAFPRTAVAGSGLHAHAATISAPLREGEEGQTAGSDLPAAGSGLPTHRRR